MNNVSFRGDITYKDRYIPNKQDNTHDVVRAHFEDQLGPYFFYLDQIAKERQALIKPWDRIKKIESEKENQKQNVNVDVDLLKSLKISSFSERRKNELYSGEQVSCRPEDLQTLKNAGIKTVFGLCPYLDKDKIEEAGLFYSDLLSLNNAEMSVFDINGDMLKDLVRNPDLFMDESGKIGGLKTFIRTLNGENPELPLPMFFGCHNGTDRTFMWFQLYNLLKDQDMTKPLSDDVVEQLARFVQEAEEYFRW